MSRRQAVVFVQIDDDGDSCLEVCWDDRRLIVSINPSRVGFDDPPHGWSFVMTDGQGVSGSDLGSMHMALAKLAAWQREEDSAVTENMSGKEAASTR